MPFQILLMEHCQWILQFWFLSGTLYSELINVGCHGHYGELTSYRNQCDESTIYVSYILECDKLGIAFELNNAIVM